MNAPTPNLWHAPKRTLLTNSATRGLQRIRHPRKSAPRNRAVDARMRPIAASTLALEQAPSGDAVVQHVHEHGGIQGAGALEREHHAHACAKDRDGGHQWMVEREQYSAA